MPASGPPPRHPSMTGGVPIPTPGLRGRRGAGREPKRPQPAVSAAVMAHPARASAARRVVDRLAPLDARLIIDPDPRGPPSSMRTARLAFAAVAPDATHHVVVQDDAWVPDGFAVSVRRALARQPDAAVSLFVEWGSRTATLVRWAALTGASWAPMVNPYVPTQALALPAEVARELARFLQTEATIEEADDEAVLRFVGRRGVEPLVTVPNLVEHLELPSLTRNQHHGVRRSACLLPHARPAVGETVLELPALLPFLAWTTGHAVTIETVDGSFSSRRPTAEVLAEWGADRAELLVAYRSAVQTTDSGTALGTRIGDRYLFELWLTAVAMGAVQRGRWPDSVRSLESRLADPVVIRSLDTMAPGGLRRFVDLRVLLNMAGELWALTVHGMRYGMTRLGPAPTS